MTTFVLVPGAWLGAAAWSDVAARLTAAGHTVHAVTLTGLADRRDEAPAASIDLSTHVEDVLHVLRDRDLHDVVLVVHSYAGTVGTLVADRAADRVARVVYLATHPAGDGQSLFEQMGRDAEPQMRAMAQATGDPARLPFPPDDLLSAFYPEHGMDDATLAALRATVTPHPLETYAERVKLSGADQTVPRTMIWCTGDGPSPIGPDTPGWDYREIPTGHWPMITHPALLAEELLHLTS